MWILLKMLLFLCRAIMQGLCPTVFPCPPIKIIQLTAPLSAHWCIIPHKHVFNTRVVQHPPAKPSLKQKGQVCFNVLFVFAQVCEFIARRYQYSIQTLWCVEAPWWHRKHDAAHPECLSCGVTYSFLHIIFCTQSPPHLQQMPCYTCLWLPPQSL